MKKARTGSGIHLEMCLLADPKKDGNRFGSEMIGTGHRDSYLWMLKGGLVWAKSGEFKEYFSGMNGGENS